MEKISYHFLENPNLSLKAKGLLAFCLYFHSDGEINISKLSLMCKEGKEALSAALNELKKHGYCKMNEQRGKDGRMLKYQYKFLKMN